MDGFCQPKGASHFWSSADKIWPLKQRKLISGPRAEELGPALTNQLSSRQALQPALHSSRQQHLE